MPLLMVLALFPILLVALARPLAGQPDVVVCASPALAIPGPTAVIVDTITVAEPLAIADLAVRIELTHTFVGDLVIDLRGPQGTSVRLHAAQGGSSDDLDVRYADAGIPNGSPYDCGGCTMRLPAPDQLSAFSGQLAAGAWQLEINDTFPTADHGTLDHWCLEVFAAEPHLVRGDAIADGVVQLSDALLLLRYLFVAGAHAPRCPDAADTDDDGQINLSDALLLLNYLFVPASPGPAAPGPLSCGLDLTPDGLPACLPEGPCN